MKLLMPHLSLFFDPTAPLYLHARLLFQETAGRTPETAPPTSSTGKQLDDLRRSVEASRPVEGRDEAMALLRALEQSPIADSLAEFAMIWHLSTNNTGTPESLFLNVQAQLEQSRKDLGGRFFEEALESVAEGYLRLNPEFGALYKAGEVSPRQLMEVACERMFSDLAAGPLAIPAERLERVRKEFESIIASSQ